MRHRIYCAWVQCGHRMPPIAGEENDKTLGKEEIAGGIKSPRFFCPHCYAYQLLLKLGWPCLFYFQHGGGVTSPAQGRTLGLLH